jgi:hypothetical protein
MQGAVIRAACPAWWRAAHGPCRDPPVPPSPCHRHPRTAPTARSAPPLPTPRHAFSEHSVPAMPRIMCPCYKLPAQCSGFLLLHIEQSALMMLHFGGLCLWSRSSSTNAGCCEESIQGTFIGRLSCQVHQSFDAQNPIPPRSLMTDPQPSTSAPVEPQVTENSISGHSYCLLGWSSICTVVTGSSSAWCCA